MDRSFDVHKERSGMEFDADSRSHGERSLLQKFAIDVCRILMGSLGPSSQDLG